MPSPPPATPGSPGLAYNEDFDHFLSHLPAEEMTADGLDRYIAQFANTQIRRFFFCPGGQRANFRSTTREAIWDGNDTTHLPPSAARWLNNARLLHERGIDLYAHWIAAARKRRISPWLSMRMNDVHHTEHLDHYMHNSFWKSHPQYWRVPGSVHAYGDRSLDYGIEAVRDHNLAFIAELLNRYDLDGLELDWMRFVFHFKPGHELRGGKILLDFWRKVRALADKAAARLGHPVSLATRVPTRPEVARGLGLDAIAWAREGFLQQVTVSPYFGSSDFDIPLHHWIELLGPVRDRVVLAPSLDMRLCVHHTETPRWLDPDSVRGFASAMFNRGADLIYLFNHHYLHKPGGGRTPVSWVREFVKNFSTAGSPDTLRNLPRRHVVTFTDVTPPGVPFASLLTCSLRFNRAAQFRLDTGPTPPAGSTVTLVVGLAERPGVADAHAEARINSVTCRALPEAPLITTEPGGDVDPKSRLVDVSMPDVVRVLQFTVDPTQLEAGHNLFEILLRSEASQKAAWVEVRITPPM